ncbi:MAG: hypothetical protein FWC42_09705 [Proteobacteria bacterium]|nr:hypothetical protein [Pseudomonadota bacterium]
MSVEREEILKERAELRQRYGVLFEKVSAILFEADPMGINFVSNTDEYEPETSTIIPRLVQASSVWDVEVIVREEFCRWFGLDELGTREHFRPIAEKIWDAWETFNRRNI